MNIVLFIAVALFLIGALYEGILRRQAEALLADEREEKKKLESLLHGRREAVEHALSERDGMRECYKILQSRYEQLTVDNADLRMQLDAAEKKAKENERLWLSSINKKDGNVMPPEPYITYTAPTAEIVNEKTESENNK